MNSALFGATTKLENQLTGIYQIIYKKKSKVALKINNYSTTKSSNAQHALLVHLLVNFSSLTGLFYLLY